MVKGFSSTRRLLSRVLPDVQATPIVRVAARRILPIGRAFITSNLLPENRLYAAVTNFHQDRQQVCLP